MSKSINFVRHLIDLTDKGELTWSYKKETDEYCSYDLDNHVLATYNNTGGVTLTTDHPGASGFSLNIDLSNHHNVRQELDESLMKYQDKVIDEHIDLTKIFDPSKSEAVEQPKQPQNVDAINLKLHPKLQKLFNDLSRTELLTYNFRPSWVLFQDGDNGVTISLAVRITEDEQAVIYYDYNLQVIRYGIATFDGVGRVKHIEYRHELLSFDIGYIEGVVMQIREHYNPQSEQPYQRVLFDQNRLGTPQAVPCRAYEPALPPHRMQNRVNAYHMQDIKQPVAFGKTSDGMKQWDLSTDD